MYRAYKLISTAVLFAAMSAPALGQTKGAIKRYDLSSAGSNTVFNATLAMPTQAFDVTDALRILEGKTGTFLLQRTTDGYGIYAKLTNGKVESFFGMGPNGNVAPGNVKFVEENNSRKKNKKKKKKKKDNKNKCEVTIKFPKSKKYPKGRTLKVKVDCNDQIVKDLMDLIFAVKPVF